MTLLKDHPSYMQRLVTVLHVIVFSKGSCIHVCHILVPNRTSFTFKRYRLLTCSVLARSVLEHIWVQPIHRSLFHGLHFFF